MLQAGIWSIGLKQRPYTREKMHSYMNLAGLEFPVDLSIVSLISRLIAISNSLICCPASALESMGPKLYFRCPSVNIGLMYKQLASIRFV